jgi:hypothetical protein
MGRAFGTIEQMVPSVRATQLAAECDLAMMNSNIVGLRFLKEVSSRFTANGKKRSR